MQMLERSPANFQKKFRMGSLHQINVVSMVAENLESMEKVLNNLFFTQMHIGKKTVLEIKFSRDQIKQRPGYVPKMGCDFCKSGGFMFGSICFNSLQVFQQG